MEQWYWRLFYPDDHHEDEPLDGGSIRLSHPGAVVLAACKHEPGPDGQDLRRPVVKINLFDDGPDPRLYVPIWYRKRSMGLNMKDAARTDATVMGRVREEKDRNNGTLWASTDGETFGNCPPWAEDPGVVESLLMTVGK